MSKLTTKAKELAKRGKEFVSDHQTEIVCAGIIVSGIVATGAYIHIHNKRFFKLWQEANNALHNGDMNHDYGPYKIMRFIEPKTRELIGEVACHEDTCKAFLDIK